MKTDVPRLRPSPVGVPTDAVEASISFCPSTGEMTIRFSGGPCEGLPPWSLELAGLTAGSNSVRVDLTAIELSDPERTVEILQTVLKHEHGVEHVTFDLTDTPAPGV